MVICTDYKIDGNRVVPLRPISCPYCEGITYSRGYINRKTKDFLGHVTWYRIQKRKCEKCGRITVVLPDFLIPYKQYDIR